MATILEHNQTYHFDFTGKRVKVNGEVQDNFSLSYFIGRIEFYSGLYARNNLYNDNKKKLLALLQEHHYANVTIAC